MPTTISFQNPSPDEWKGGEYTYCRDLVAAAYASDRAELHALIGTDDPKTIATYLRLQAAQACRDHKYELSARLGAAATAINEDARNDHPADWGRALQVLNAIWL